MTKRRKITSTFLVVFGMCLVALMQQGCSKSPSEKLIGRWYSGDMTIRFREDSGVIWNSPRGLALGKYEFSGKTRNVRYEKEDPNLFIDVVRNDERQQFQFEISFLGPDRLRIQLIPIGKEVTGSDAARGMVLRRANDNALGGAIVKVAQK
jgi:hypothetical protein